MLHRITDMRGAKVGAVDGEIGSVEDFYLDDERWGVRYLVVETGGWLDRKRVLISPTSVQREGISEDLLQLNLTRQQVRDSPAIDEDMPVSRRYEIAHAAYYRYPMYWTGPLMWGGGAYPSLAPGEALEAGLPEQPELQDEAAAQAREGAEESHVHSSDELIGYTVKGRDGDIGRLDDFVIDDEDWGVRRLLVDTRVWWPGGQVTVPPDAVETIDWANSEVSLSMDRETAKRQPSGLDS